MDEEIDEIYLEYLDNLREANATNMYEAAQYLENEFDLNRKESKAILLYWMETFSKRHLRD